MANERTTDLLEGFLVSAFYSLAIGDDDRGTGMTLLAERIWTRFQSKVAKQRDRVGLAPMKDLKEEALRQFEQQYPPLLTARLRIKLGLPPSTNAPPAATVPPSAAP